MLISPILVRMTSLAHGDGVFGLITKCENAAPIAAQRYVRLGRGCWLNISRRRSLSSRNVAAMLIQIKQTMELEDNFFLLTVFLIHRDFFLSDSMPVS